MEYCSSCSAQCIDHFAAGNQWLPEKYEALAWLASATLHGEVVFFGLKMTWTIIDHRCEMMEGDDARCTMQRKSCFFFPLPSKEVPVFMRQCRLSQT